MRYLPETIEGFRGTYGFLSNMYPAPLVYDDIPYLSAEAAYHANKSKTREERYRFMNYKGPEAKYYGRKLDLREDWRDVRDEIMYGIVFQKFSSNPHLSQQLLATGEVPLIEKNYWKDTYWGMYNGNGLNKLGKILMRVRSELREGGQP